MSNHRWCCCGEAGDCCDMQNCATFVAPNSITITYTGTITRTFDTGQVCTLAEYTYTISSVGNFQPRGNSCDPEFPGTPPRHFSCPQANISYQYRTWAWQPKNLVVTCPCPPWCETPPWIYPCSACIPPDETGTVYNMTCDARPRDANYFLLVCRDTYTGNTRMIQGAGHTDPGWIQEQSADCCTASIAPTTGQKHAITLFCCENCKCARPTILFSPETNQILAGFHSLLGHDTYTHEEIICSPNIGTTTVTGAWETNWFSLSGECGCPDSATWSNPIGVQCSPLAMPVVFHENNAHLVPCTNAVMSTCQRSLSCEGLFQGVCESGKLMFEGLCYRFDDPTNSTYYQYVFSYTDSVTQSVSVVIT